jgi:hypothetical protein
MMACISGNENTKNTRNRKKSQNTNKEKYQEIPSIRSAIGIIHRLRKPNANEEMINNFFNAF